MQDHDTPILGVNLGRLGFLAGAEPGELEDDLDRVLTGDYKVESRMALVAEVDGQSIFCT